MEITTDVHVNKNENETVVTEEKCSIVSSTTENALKGNDTSSSTKEKESKIQVHHLAYYYI